MAISETSQAKLNCMVGVQTMAQTMQDQIVAYSSGALASEPVEKALVDAIHAACAAPLAELNEAIAVLQEAAAQA